MQLPPLFLHSSDWYSDSGGREIGQVHLKAGEGWCPGRRCRQTTSGQNDIKCLNWRKLIPKQAVSWPRKPTESITKHDKKHLFPGVRRGNLVVECGREVIVPIQLVFPQERATGSLFRKRLITKLKIIISLKPRNHIMHGKSITARKIENCIEESKFLLRK